MLKFVSFDVRPCLETGHGVTSFTDLSGLSRATAELLDSGIEFKSYWTLYGVGDGGLSDAIADYPSEAIARDMAVKLAQSTISAITTPRGHVTLPSALERNAHAMTALCLCEAMNDARDSLPAMDSLWQAVGTYEMRALAMRLCPAIDSLYAEYWPDGCAASFDWEWLPALLPHIDWHAGALLPDATNEMLRLFSSD